MFAGRSQIRSAFSACAPTAFSASLGDAGAATSSNAHKYAMQQTRHRHRVHHPGASMFAWNIVKPYVKRTDNLIHYPEVSTVTGKQIDWMYDTPKSGYEGVSIYGPNTLELKGMPMGRTPEYMQERLRRFFSKFGPVRHCRALPHPLDCYQCEGTAYISFRTRQAALAAIRAPLRFPGSLHYKIVRMRHLDSDKVNDHQYIYKAEHWNRQIADIAAQLYKKLGEEGPTTLDLVWKGLKEKEFMSGRMCVADVSVYERFKTWDKFLTFAPFDDMFDVSGNDTDPEETRVVRRKLLSEDCQDRVLTKAKLTLQKKLADELSVHWRAGKIPLPAYTKKLINAWDHTARLPEELQYMSRHKGMYRVHDERMILKVKLRKERNKSKAEFRKQLKMVELAKQQQKLAAEGAPPTAFPPGAQVPLVDGVRR